MKAAIENVAVVALRRNENVKHFLQFSLGHPGMGQGRLGDPQLRTFGTRTDLTSGHQKMGQGEVKRQGHSVIFHRKSFIMLNRAYRVFVSNF